jgi:hypothetical protein
MSISPEINALIQRLNSELGQLEQETTEGLNLVRIRLNLFPGNSILIQLFAYLSNVLVFADNLKRRIDYSSTVLATDMVTQDRIQEIAEDLSEQFGRVLESKIAVNRIRERLRN